MIIRCRAHSQYPTTDGRRTLVNFWELVVTVIRGAYTPTNDFGLYESGHLVSNDGFVQSIRVLKSLIDDTDWYHLFYNNFDYIGGAT